MHDSRRRALKRGGTGFRDAGEMWEMYDSQSGLCAYCETPLFGDFHVDHMVPLSRGGDDDCTNYAISCPSCNLEKHDKTAEEYMMSKFAKK